MKKQLKEKYFFYSTTFSVRMFTNWACQMSITTRLFLQLQVTDSSKELMQIGNLRN